MDNFIEFDIKLFREILTFVSRLFFTDEEIVILDLFLYYEKSFTDIDISKLITIPEKRIREICCTLEKYQVLIRAKPVIMSSNYHASSRHKSESQPIKASTYKMNPYCIAALHWRSKHLIEELQESYNNLCDKLKFKCLNCNEYYDSLSVQSLQLHPFDAQFICFCGEKVIQEDSEQKQQILKSQIDRVKVQIKPLIDYLEPYCKMIVPDFVNYSAQQDNKADIKVDKPEDSNIKESQNTANTLNEKNNQYSSISKFIMPLMSQYSSEKIKESQSVITTDENTSVTDQIDSSKSVGSSKYITRCFILVQSRGQIKFQVKSINRKSKNNLKR